MRLRFYRRGAVIRNQMVFILLSLVYVQIITAISAGSSALDIEAFLQLLEQHKIIVGLGAVTFLLVYMVKTLAKYLFFLYALGITFLSIKIFLQSFDKLILVLSCTYILVAYYFYLLFSEELKQSIYYPGFFDNTVGPKCEYNIPLSIQSSKVKTKGILSNWDAESCFVVIDKNGKIPKGKVGLTLNFEGKEFSFEGFVNTKIGHGVGIRLQLERGEAWFGWPEFYEIIEGRGYRPRFSTIG